MFVSAALALLENASTRLTCADIGSAGGFHPRLRAIRSHADILGFDADPAECRLLNERVRGGERHINAAIGRDDERVTLELHGKRNTSSLYSADAGRLKHFHDPGRVATQSTVSFTTRSLDSVCRAEGIGRIDYIKVDVEGHELAVLQGYTGPLLAAEVEVTFHPWRKGVPLFDEVMAHMRRQGFILLDLRRTFWSPVAASRIASLSTKGFLIFGDAFFVRDPFARETFSLLGDAGARARYLALLCLYGYAPEALAAIESWREAGLMADPEASQAADLIVSRCPRRQRVPARLGRVLLFLERYIRLPVSIRSGLFLSGWAQADREVGNWE